VHQYRAELEAIHGAQNEVLIWLEKSFGDTKRKKHINDNKRSIYDIYNLL